MEQALSEVLSLGVAAAIRPSMVIALVVLLATPRGRSNGLGFTLGFLIGLTVVAIVWLVLANTTNLSDSDTPPTWASALKLAFGVLFLIGAVLIWSRRPKAGEHVPMPKWMDGIDKLTPGKVFGLGVVLGIANGKNLILTGIAAIDVVQLGIPTDEEVGSMAVYVAVAALCVLIPLAFYLLGGRRAKHPLERLRVWMIEHTPVLMAILFVLIGLGVTADAISELA